MTPRSVHSGQWNARRILGILLGLTLSGSTTAFAATSVFKLADDSTVVARGVVGSVQRYKDDTFLVFSITPRDVLKGSPAGDTSLLLVEERVFGTERPYFTSGDETLVFAVPLPPYSSYRQALPAGSYLRWTEIKDTTSDMAPLADPAVAAAVKTYLSLANDSNGRLRYLATVLASSVPRLRADALTEIGSRRAAAGVLDAATLEPVRRMLDDEGVPVSERRAVLVTLGQVGAPGIVPIAGARSAGPGPLQAAAIDALVLAGHVPPEELLLAASHSDDPAVRSAAVDGLAQTSSRAGYDRAADIIRDDGAPEVRLAAVKALGGSHDARAVAVLANAMQGHDKTEVLAAGESLGRIGSPQAISVLGEQLRDGTFEAETAAVFALNQTNKPEAAAILREQRDLHPDAQVRRLIKMALGEHLEEHEE